MKRTESVTANCKCLALVSTVAMFPVLKSDVRQKMNLYKFFSYYFYILYYFLNFIFKFYFLQFYFFQIS